MSSVLFAEEGGLFLYKPKHPEAVLSSFNKAFDKKQKKVFTLARQYGNMVPHKIILEVYFMNKKLITLLSLTLVAVLLIGFAACGGNGGGESSTLPAGESDGSTEPVEVVADYDYIKNEKNNELIIGITLFEPMNYEDENGEYTGFETEFAKAVCEKLGFTPKFQVINWGAKETELKAKNIDCIWNGMTIDAEREANIVHHASIGITGSNLGKSLGLCINSGKLRTCEERIRRDIVFRVALNKGLPRGALLCNYLKPFNGCYILVG